MINIEIEIAGKEVAFCYQMGAGEIEALFMLTPDDAILDMSELLLIDHIYTKVEDHYRNMMIEAQACH